MHLSPGATGPLKFRATLQSSSGPQAPYAKICRAFMSWSWTLELSPPQSQRMAANANWLVWTCWTPLGWSLECITWISCTLLTQSWTAELSPPEPCWPYLPRDSKTKIAAAPLPGRHRNFKVSARHFKIPVAPRLLMQKSAARLWADLELWSCHRHNLKGWQQMQTGWFWPAEHPWAGHWNVSPE